MSVSEFESGATARPARGVAPGEASGDAPRRFGTRIDPPHVIDRGQAPAAPGGELPADVSEAAAQPERLLRQARQLADFLRQRRWELDRREAQAHAAIAQAESQDRESRHWFQERQLELEQREALLIEREQALESATLIHQAAEQELHEQRAAVERTAQRNARRARQLEALERVLGRRRRETLEWRLALEELWADVAGAMDPAELANRVNELRERLAGEYREMHASLSRRELRLLRLQRELTGRGSPRRGRG